MEELQQQLVKQQLEHAHLELAQASNNPELEVQQTPPTTAAAAAAAS